jgi:carboxypeptidase Taq
MMDNEFQLANLKKILNEIHDIRYAASVLSWDQQTQMPSAGANNRGYQVSTLYRLAHMKFTSPELGQLLQDLAPYAAEIDPDSDDARLIRVTSHEYEKFSRVPTDLVAEFAQVTTEAYKVWEQAREESDFTKFQPYLTRIITLRRQYAECHPYDHIYDPLLDDYESGLKTVEVQAIFNELRPKQVDLIQSIGESRQVDDLFLKQTFDETRQWEFGVNVISQFGYDWKRGRLDKSAHPFTIRLGRGDVRITTRVSPDKITSALFGTIHECGHALYEQGVNSSLDRTPLGEGASYAMHESQSRLYENLIGRSRDFWVHYYPKLQDAFPAQLGNIDLEQFYKGINRVQPSLVRVEADEATYNLHIMLRLELEIALMEGSLEVEELPEAWNARMQDYLGITPPDDKHGVLQDVHWSSGYIGYFPTYALGNLIASQLWDCLEKDIPDLRDQIREGQFGDLLDWLRQNIHQHGKKFGPQELVERVTGSKIEPSSYLRYLWEKYGEIYGI